MAMNVYLGKLYPAATWLTSQTENRLFFCITNLAEVIAELRKWPKEAQSGGFSGAGLSEVKPIKDGAPGADSDTLKNLTVGETMELANLAEATKDLMALLGYVDGRKAEILDAARQRAGRAEQ